MITVLTPTFNRAHLLPRLMASLSSQTSGNFEWFVVDDGSLDSTASLIDAFQKNSDIPVRYRYKDNGGKHSALNVGFREASGDWIFVVDSDDWLSNDCIEKLYDYIESVDETVGAVSTLKVFQDGRVIGDKFPKGLETYLDKIEKRVVGDKADLFRKKVLKGFSFPVFPGEPFMAEEPLFIWLGERTLTKFVNYAGYICEYQDDGLSAGSIINRHRCFRSSLFVYDLQYKTFVSRFLRFKAGVNWWRFRIGKSMSVTSYKVSWFYFPAGLVLFLRDSFGFGFQVFKVDSKK